MFAALGLSAVAACSKPADQNPAVEQAGEKAALNWQLDYAKVMEQAKAQKKLALVYFTGSDWCPYCIYLDRDVMSRPEYVKYANENLVMMLCDFPRKNPPPEARLKANMALGEKFGIQGYPTVVLVNPENGQTAKLGWSSGITPEKFIAEIEKFKSDSGGLK